MEKYLGIGKAAEELGVSVSTLRLWDKKGLLVPIRTPTGHRRYHVSQLKSFEINKYERISKGVLIYARVSTQKQANAGNLDRQIGRLTEYATSNKMIIKGVFSDIASGLNENRRGLRNLLKAIKEDGHILVIIEYKDRLARFGYAYIERHIKELGGQVLILEEKESNEQQELVEDLIAITTSFSAQIYGKRGGRVAKTLTEVIESEVNGP